MQPNPGDTTNDLLLHLIKITAYGPSAVPDISSLSSFTGYPSSIVWMRTLACASLAFSVLAAFGAVMGKQWLNSYKAARGRGSLEERGMRRQMKLDGLEDFRLQAVLQGFLVLLQVSLLFFSLSLCANMWTQQTTISSVLICTTSFGILFYAGTVCMSAWRPDSPFQSPGSVIFPVTSTLAPDTSNIHQEQKPTMRPETIRNNLSNSRRRRGRHPSSRAEAISKEFLSVTSTLAPNHMHAYVKTPWRIMTVKSYLQSVAKQWLIFAFNRSQLIQGFVGKTGILEIVGEAIVVSFTMHLWLAVTPGISFRIPNKLTLLSIGPMHAPLSEQSLSTDWRMSFHFQTMRH
ncbi:hypothetical protein DFH29DRAFT_936974 [Suillus ampliporus]|nr:hypothetical protein DFH29DRAFT_936974 [Suillus ampliporus]